MALEAGSRLGPYEVVGLLGSGGMGEVYRARDPRLEREVAIKVLPAEIADRKHLRRFEQEARAAGALNHPNILAVYDVGTHDGAPYVVSELLEGHTLKVRLRGRSASRPQGPRPRAPDRPRPRRRSRQGDRPPRPQARQRLHHERRPGQDPRLRPRQADAPDAARPGRRPAHRHQGRRNRAWCWGRWASCRPSRSGARRWTPARTSSPSGRCSTRCSRARERSGATARSRR